MCALWRRIVAFLYCVGEYPEESPDQRLKRRIFESRGTIAVKGKGDMETWILESSSNASA